MTTHDTIKLFALISASYPREQAFANASQEMVSLWARLLSDIPLSAAESAIASHVSTSPFPPSIAEIREWAAGGPGDGAAAEAWGKLMQAVRKYGWCNQVEAKAYLGPEIWAAMLRTFPDWLALCMSETWKQTEHIFADVGKRCEAGADQPHVAWWSKCCGEIGGCMTQQERSEQIMLIEWAELMQRRIPALKWLYHVPNGGKRDPVTGHC